MSGVKKRVWDRPTRLFHWAVACLFCLSWGSAEYHFDTIHLWSGLSILFLLVFRIGWGLAGGSTARFSTFVQGPASVFRYVRARFRWHQPGHAPLGAYSVVALLLILVAQVSTGLISLDEDGIFGGPLAHLVSDSTSQWARHLHSALFNILLALIGLHIAAILLYRLALGRNLVGPMITGKAALEPGVEPLRPAKSWAAPLCLFIAASLTAWIAAGAPPLGS